MSTDRKPDRQLSGELTGRPQTCDYRPEVFRVCRDMRIAWVSDVTEHYGGQMIHEVDLSPRARRRSSRYGPSHSGRGHGGPLRHGSADVRRAPARTHGPNNTMCRVAAFASSRTGSRSVSRNSHGSTAVRLRRMLSQASIRSTVWGWPTKVPTTVCVRTFSRRRVKLPEI